MNQSRPDDVADLAAGRIFNLDKYIGMAGDDQRPYRSHMRVVGERLPFPY